MTIPPNGHPYKKSNINYLKPEPVDAGYGAIEAFAVKIRNDLGFSNNDDLEKYVKELGGEIIYQSPNDLYETDSGSILVHHENCFQIFISNVTSYLRNRFTIAHELGHYFLHSKQGEISIEVDRFDSNQVEWEANRFAAAFLMPHEQVENEWEKADGSECEKVRKLAIHFNVSLDTMRIRLKSLGNI
jgi:Zn-dependent peptidase ImmA (M78 family)